MLKEKMQPYWFPAKKYGWGWGLPRTWQGWLVLTVYLVCLSVGALALLPEESPFAYIGYCFALTALLLTVCYIKGEPPRWRWGK